MAGVIHCSVLSPEGSIFEGEVTFIEAHALDGRLGILPSHAPIITALGAGPLRVRIEGQEDRKWQVSGGFLEMLDNHASVLAEGLVED